MKLDSVVKGKRDIYIAEANGAFENPEVVNIVGDGKAVVELVPVTGDADNPDGKPNLLRLKVEGGTVGSNTSFDVLIDGHVGDGIVPVITSLDFDTVSPDATKLTFGTKVRSEDVEAAA